MLNHGARSALVTVALLAATVFPTAANTIWQPQPLPFSIDPGSSLGFALDTSGNHTFSYRGLQGGLYYARHDGAGWDSSLVASGLLTGGASSLLHVGDTPHMTYGQDLGHTIGFYHAWHEDGVWYTQSISDTAGRPRHSSFAADADGDLAVAWLDQYGLGADDDTLDFAIFDGASWTTQRVSETPMMRGNLDLVLDGLVSEARLAYIDMQPGFFTPNEPTWAERSAGSWSADIGLGGTQEGIFAEYISATIDSDGNPALVYLDTWTGGLHYAVRTDTGWTVETIEDIQPVSTYSDRRYTALATDQMGFVHLLYFDPEAGGEIKYRYRDPQGWSDPRSIAQTTAHWLALEIDHRQAPHFAYFDAQDETVYSGFGTPVPEPGTLALIIAGIAALALRRRRAGNKEHEQQ